MDEPLASPFSHILFCTDFSDNADLAFHYASHIASLSSESELTILHVIQEPDAQFWQSYLHEIEDVDNQAQKAIENAMEERYVSGLPAHQIVNNVILQGRDYAKILEYSKANDIDLIVIGRQGKSEIATILFGNVTEKITRHAECNVLVVPQRKPK